MADNAPVRKATWRMGARQRERLQWAVVAAICVLLFFALRPYYFHIVETRDFQTCQSNMLQIAGALGRYKADWDETLPSGDHWMDTLLPYLAPRSGTGFKAEDLFHCPRDKSGQPSSYAWNTLFDGYSESQKATSPQAIANRAILLRPGRDPLILERYGTPQNGTVRPLDWSGVAGAMTTPHAAPPTTSTPENAAGSYITGALKPSSLDREKLGIYKGDKF